MPAASIRALLASSVDYAGLFPPAGRSMADAVAAFARERRGADAWMLGSFVVPFGRLGELESAVLAQPQARGERDVWPLSVLLSLSPAQDVLALESFRGRLRGRLAVGAVEIPPIGSAAIAGVFSLLPQDLAVFCEVPTLAQTAPERIDEDLDAIAAVGAHAKVRTGGLDPSAFPSTGTLARFLHLCHEKQVPFKATAGLHHAVRGGYPLTYERDSPSSLMHGFLNLAVAAALIGSQPQSIEEASAVLAETDAGAFDFDERTIVWQQRTVDVDAIERCRRSFFLSFGSCSFAEPVAELRSLELLAAASTAR